MERFFKTVRTLKFCLDRICKVVSLRNSSFKIFRKISRPERFQPHKAFPKRRLDCNIFSAFNLITALFQKIRFDIDRLIYCSINIEDLLNKLQERGYEIKRGKYLAVKPDYAERFVRLKTLGDAYLMKNLEQRIADKDNFPNAVREKFQSTNAIEKKIQITIMDMVVAIKQFRFTPKKLAPKKIYVFQNDADINYLSEQLRTIRDFNFS